MYENRIDIHLKKGEFFTLQDYMDGDTFAYVVTGARGVGKTYSADKLIKKYFSERKIALFLRNDKKYIPTARQYFSCLAGATEEIRLGGLGAGTITLYDTDTKEYTLVGYSLALPDYEAFKSSKRKVDYCIYEEFSTFTADVHFNRIFALSELIVSIRQQSPAFKLYAFSNALFFDSIFYELLPEKDFKFFHITKEKENTFNSEIINNYIAGDFLIEDYSYNLSRHSCKGYVEYGGLKIYVYEWRAADAFPPYVLSSKGSGKKIPLDFDILDIILHARYKNLTDRNRLEFAVGLMGQLVKRLKA